MHATKIVLRELNLGAVELNVGVIRKGHPDGVVQGEN